MDLKHDQIGGLLQRQQQAFTQAYEEFSEELQNTAGVLQEYFRQAYDNLETGKYIVNTSVLKQLRMYLSQISKIAILAGNGSSLFLLSVGALQTVPIEQPDIDKLVEQSKDKTQLSIRKWALEQRFVARLKSRCTAVTAISLISNPLKLQQMIADSDLTKIKVFTKISRLSIPGSNISDEGLISIGHLFENLKQIDLSDCKLVSNQGVRYLCGYRFVSVKLSGCDGVTQRALLSLVATSYNLNYLEVCRLKQCNSRLLLNDIANLYAGNKLNFKWLQLTNELGTVLFVNKLAYLTHLASAQSITDRQVEILLGEKPLLDGLYFNCCEQLHCDTIVLISSRCLKVKRLGLRRFPNLTDGLVGDFVSKLIKLQHIDLSDCRGITSRALIEIANQLRKLRELTVRGCAGIGDQGLLYLIEKMPTLLALDISGCKAITNRVIFQIGNYLPALQILHAAGCDQLTNQSIVYLSERTPQLEELVLSSSGLSETSASILAMRHFA